MVAVLSHVLYYYVYGPFGTSEHIMQTLTAHRVSEYWICMLVQNECGRPAVF